MENFVRQHPIQSITDEETALFESDGAVVLRGLFDLAWIARLHGAIERLRNRPGPLSEVYCAEGGDGGFYGDRFTWTLDPDVRAFVHESPAGEIVGRLMRASKVRLYCDHILVKEPGTTAATPWHHDLQAWPIEGRQVASLWLALDPITRENGAVEYVAGSHRWGRRFRSDTFGRSGRAGQTFGTNSSDEEYEACPDINGERNLHRLLCWDMAPGDCVVFHALTVHGAPGNRSSATRRRALSTRWAGDDVVWVQRRGKTAKLIRDSGLKPGDPLDQSDLFPLVWERG
jgi:ectoine hydroxylase-related dioxygenase (phytanoyl-CoA dioxygenase family)